MNFFRRSFGAKDKVINSHEDFWNWLRKNEWEFFTVVKSGNDIEEKYLQKQVSVKNVMCNPGQESVTDWHNI